MCSMCHLCGEALTMSNGGMENQEHAEASKLNGKDPVWSCKFCGEKQEKESVERDDLSPYAAPLISPIHSLTSSDSTVSSCSDFSVDAYSGGRDYQDEGSSTRSREDLNFRPNGHHQSMNLPIHVNGIHESNSVVNDNFKEDSNVNSRFTASGDAEIVGNGDNQEAKDNAFESASTDASKETETSLAHKDEMDAQVWVPPEAEDQEDDREGSVVNYDEDDDECGDGTKWGKPSCLSSLGEEGRGNFRFREEKQKAMAEVMNGKFKALVGQLLRSVGVALSGGDGESWLDVVTSLSWEAASFVKPDVVAGKAMDPDGYVKIKCVATGSRSQSQVIRGLVFKKHAAHKHMPTKYKNRRLFLIQGALGLSSSGLSSFDTMLQEKDNQKSIIETIEICHPNMVLVEKTISRDI